VAVVAVEAITGGGQQLFEGVRQLGAEGIVSKRWQPYRGDSSRDGLTVKVGETAAFVIAGYIEHEAVAVAACGTSGAIARARSATACCCRSADP
jgi:ATP-dependent DNA ligase